jgi:hypothetical protein
MDPSAIEVLQTVTLGTMGVVLTIIAVILWDIASSLEKIARSHK